MDRLPDPNRDPAPKVRKVLRPEGWAVRKLPASVHRQIRENPPERR